MITAVARLAPALGLRGARRTHLAAPPSRRRRARFVLVCFALAALGLHAVALVVLDELGPGLRDPEYARRVAQLRQRIAENPGRPVVLVIGSSRTAMGVRPGEWEAIRPAVPGHPDPLIFNMSLLGGGPVMNLMVLRRLHADGLRPDVVLFEYWPPYLHSEGAWAEPQRIAPDRLYPTDRDIVRGYFPDPAKTERQMWNYRWNPVSAARNRLLVQLFPKWLPNDKRLDWTWDTVDEWGWKPGFDYPPGPTPERTEMLGKCHDIYKPLFSGFKLSPDADRAIREEVAEARAHGSAVGFVYLPEASEFRGWYPPRVERLAREHLARLSRELSVPVIDCRLWMDDGLFVDGFHLSRVGAAEFTRKFGPAVASTRGGRP
jgi:lysophospholipase L1-like esterase